MKVITVASSYYKCVLNLRFPYPPSPLHTIATAKIEDVYKIYTTIPLHIAEIFYRKLYIYLHFKININIFYSGSRPLLQRGYRNRGHPGQSTYHHKAEREQYIPTTFYISQ